MVDDSAIVEKEGAIVMYTEENHLPHLKRSGANHDDLQAPNVLCLTAIARIWVGDQDPKCP